MHNEMIERILIDQDALRDRISALGQEISVDYAGKDLVLVCVLKGGITFLTDLMREITVPHEVDFLAMVWASGRPRERYAWSWI
jgi:hypoxanthine phosphoribosyltransferase